LRPAARLPIAARPDDIDPGELVLSIGAMPSELLALILPDADLNDPASVVTGFAAFVIEDDNITLTSDAEPVAGLEDVASISIRDEDGVDGAIFVVLRGSATVIVSAAGDLNRYRANVTEILAHIETPAF
jgi:hypothetical protein